MQTSDIHFGQNLRRVRKEKRITLQHLADETNVSLAAIKSAEHGNTLPGLYNAVCLAAAVGCSLDELCREHGKHTEADALAYMSRIKALVDEFFAA